MSRVAAAASARPTVGVVLRRAERYLARHGVAEPRAGAELLLADVLRTDRTGLAARDLVLDPAQARDFGRALCLRCSGAPVQHLLGDTGFRRIVLTVRPGVFIPRPETEVLVERVLLLLRDIERPRVLDVGTGTGAIALAIKDERADARVVAIDRSRAAVELARVNATRLGLDVEVQLGDPLADGASIPSPLDAVVANPPYVAADQYEGLPADVRADPYEALVGDLSVYAALVSLAASVLTSRGIIAVEIGETMGRDVCDMMRRAGFDEVTLSTDLAGRDRVVTARRSPPAMPP